MGDYSEWLAYEKQHANDARSHHKEREVNLSGEVFSIPGSISYFGSNDSDEGRGSSEACSAAYGGLSHNASIDRSRKFISSKVPVARK